MIELLFLFILWVIVIALWFAKQSVLKKKYQSKLYLFLKKYGFCE